MPDTPNIVVVGSVNMDLVALGGPIPAPGQTVSGREFRLVHGGKGANQAVAAARLGAGVTFVGRVGDDEFGRLLRAGLAAEGIDCHWLQTVPSCSSGVALIHVAPDGENAICVVPGANHRLTPGDVEEAAAAIRAARVLVLQLEIPIETALHAIQIARRSRVPIVLDPAPAPLNPPAELLRVDILTPNALEAGALAGTLDTDPSAEAGDAAEADALALLRRGAESVVLKLGAQGALIADADGVRRFPSRKVDVRDTTGAGDAFTAALAFGRARGQGLAEAVEFAIAAGGVACTRVGAQPSMPRLSEVEALLRAGRS